MDRRIQNASSTNAFLLAVKVGDGALVVLLSAFIIYTLYDYVHWSAYLFVLVLFAVSVRYLDGRYQSRWKIVLLFILVLTVVVFIAGTWNIYRIGGLRIFPDTGGYVTVSEYAALSLDFVFRGIRTFVTPAVIKAFQADWSKINIFYIVLYLSTAIAFMYVASAYFDRPGEKLIAVFLLIILFVNQRFMSLWLTTALSEIPSIVTTLAAIMIFGAAYRKRDFLRRRRWAGWLTVGLVAAVSFLFAGSRDTNNYFVPFLIPFYFLVFKRWRMRCAVAAAVAAVFFAHQWGMKESSRWKCPLANVVTQRIIPDERLRRLFQQRYHLPEDDIVMPCGGLWIYDDHPNLAYVYSRFEQRDDWVTVYGLDAYRRFLATNPRYTLGRWLDSWDMYNTPLWSYADERIRERSLNRFAYNYLGEIPAAAAIALLVLGLILFMKNPLILFCLLHAVVIGIIAYHGDAMEVPRHCQQAAMTLRIALLLCVVQVYGALTRSAPSR